MFITARFTGADIMRQPQDINIIQGYIIHEFTDIGNQKLPYIGEAFFMERFINLVL
jgi:hypothetical protein